MTDRLKYFALAGVSLIAVIFITASAYTGIVYISDCVKSFFIRNFNLYENPETGATVIKGSGYRKYTRTYRELPDGMFHFANMLFYKGDKNIRLSELSSSAIGFTGYYKLNSLKQDLLATNRISQGIINSGEIIMIKRSLPPYIADIRSERGGNIKSARGLYFSGDKAGAESFITKLPLLKASGINAIVFDVKDITGIVHTKSKIKTVTDYGLSRQGAIDNLPMLIRVCRENGIYIIARIAVFHDQLLWASDPSARIRSKSTGGVWNHKKHEKWCDPTNKKVQDYNIALAVELAESGVDEVQFDYIRFPTLGEREDAAFVYSEGRMERVEVITRFLKRAHEEIRRAGAFLSIDIFGVVAWGKGVDIDATGQQVGELAKYCDVISPMLYPSHFNDNFDGFKNPGDHPYHFILDGCRKVIELSGGRVIVRPWLQAFGWRVSNYNAAYIAEQVKGANESGARGYLFWNASNRYDEVFRSMGH